MIGQTIKQETINNNIVNNINNNKYIKYNNNHSNNLYFPLVYSSMQLKPTMIGLIHNHAPLQFIPLFNNFTHDIKLSIKLVSSNDKITQYIHKSNVSQNTLTLLNSDCLVKSKSYQNIKVQFIPIQPKIYQFNLQILCHIILIDNDGKTHQSNSDPFKVRNCDP